MESSLPDSRNYVEPVLTETKREEPEQGLPVAELQREEGLGGTSLERPVLNPLSSPLGTAMAEVLGMWEACTRQSQESSAHRGSSFYPLPLPCDMKDSCKKPSAQIKRNVWDPGTPQCRKKLPLLVGRAAPLLFLKR